MIALRVLVKAAAHNAAVAKDDAANGGIGRSQTDALPRKIERSLHPLRVLPDLGHRWFRRRAASL
jgi:hypothetical protein